MFKRFILVNLFIIVFSVISCVSVSGQKAISNYGFDTIKTYKIILFDETQFIGKFLYKDSSNIIIRTISISHIEVPISKIKSLEVVEPLNIRNGVYWFPNPNPTRYLFSPSAFNLKKGEGYYQNTYLVINSFNVGLTDNVSLGGGFELISTFTGTPVFFFTPKVGFKVKEDLHIGGGAMIITIPSFYGENNANSLGFLYGISTFGNVDKNLTTGLGWGFVGGNFSPNPFITFSGLIRLSKNTAFVSENWLIPTSGYTAIFSYGLRFFGERISVDLAFLNNPDIAKGIAIGVPWVDFVVKFN